MVGEHIGFGLCVLVSCVRAFMFPSIRAMALKLHVWIPHNKYLTRIFSNLVELCSFDMGNEILLGGYFRKYLKLGRLIIYYMLKII